jgi:hypothetical protein
MHDNDAGILDDRGEVLDWTVGDLPEAPDQGRDAYGVPLVSCNDTSQRRSLTDPEERFPRPHTSPDRTSLS